MKKLLKIALILGTVTISLVCGNRPIQAETITEQKGNIKAELSYESGEFCIESPIQLKLTRNQKVVLDELIDSTEICRLSSYHEPPLTIKNLDQNDEPEIIVDFYTGGAHCCFFSLVYRYNSTSNQYEKTEKYWYNTPYSLQDENKDNIPEFHATDNRFAYQFAAFAFSGLPIQIWRYEQGKFKDVTRQYPELVYNNAYYWWQAFQAEQKNCDPGEACGEGWLAAYVASKALLDQETEALRLVRQAYQGSGCTLEGCVGSETFFEQLQSFLQETGYIRD